MSIPVSKRGFRCRVRFRCRYSRQRIRRLLTREELASELGRLTGLPAFGAKLAESSWGTVLKPAAFAGRLCFGPSLGQRVRFTRPDTWLSAALAPMDSQTATAAVTRRFLSAYGPPLITIWRAGGVVPAAFPLPGNR